MVVVGYTRNVEGDSSHYLDYSLMSYRFHRWQYVYKRIALDLCNSISGLEVSEGWSQQPERAGTWRGWLMCI